MFYNSCIYLKCYFNFISNIIQAYNSNYISQIDFKLYFMNIFLDYKSNIIHLYFMYLFQEYISISIFQNFNNNSYL